MIEDRGCELLYLPPYSPDLNPIEEAFSKVKRLLRVIGARMKEALVESIGKALDAVGARDARGFFTRCGLLRAGATTMKRRCRSPLKPQRVTPRHSPRVPFAGRARGRWRPTKLR